MANGVSSEDVHLSVINSKIEDSNNSSPPSEYISDKKDKDKDFTTIFDGKTSNIKNGYIKSLTTHASDNSDTMLPQSNENQYITLGDTKAKENACISKPLENGYADLVRFPQFDKAFDESNTCDKEEASIKVRDNENDICYSVGSTKGGDILQNDGLGQESLKKETKPLFESVYSNETKVDETSDNKESEITTDQLREEPTVGVSLVENDDSFGDFDTAFAPNRNNDNDSIFPSKDFVNPIESATLSYQDTDNARGIDPFSDESDDDFGDFGEVVAAPTLPDLSCADTLAQTSVLSSNNTPEPSIDAICNSVRNKQ